MPTGRRQGAHEPHARHLHRLGGCRRRLLLHGCGTVGLLRLPDPLTRLHALTKADNLGLGLVVLGLLPQTDGPFGALKLIIVWLLVQLAGATVAQLIARGARRGMPQP
jgi:multicomponent Na+:H+ antiporter subunit G